MSSYCLHIETSLIATVEFLNLAKRNNVHTHSRRNLVLLHWIQGAPLLPRVSKQLFEEDLHSLLKETRRYDERASFAIALAVL